MKFWFAWYILLVAISCGTDRRQYDGYNGGGGSPPDPGGGGDPGDGSLSYAQMNGLMQNYCASCHASAGFMQSEKALRAGSVKNRLWNESMPPSNAGRKLPDTERQLMLSFF